MKTGKPYKTKTQQFFHKLRVEPDNRLRVNGLIGSLQMNRSEHPTMVLLHGNT